MLTFSTSVRLLPSFFFLFQCSSGQAGCEKVDQEAGSGMANWFNGVCPDSGQNSGQATYIIPQDDTKASKRSIWNNNSWIPPEFRYQVSPYLKTAATLRACSGSAVTTYDTENANLYGRGQNFVSQRNPDHSCCDTDSKEPIRLFSGFGRSVTVIEEDIFFPGGVIHITDGYFTIPSLLSLTLPEVEETCGLADALLSSLATLDHTPSITVFVPADSAVLSAIQCSETLSEEDARTLLGAHAVQGVVAYSPLIIDGAFFRTVGGEDITISVSNGTKYANNAKIIREDIIIKNGVVHVIDQAFFTPPADCEPRSTSSTSTYSSKSTSTLTSTLSPTSAPEPTRASPSSYHSESIFTLPSSPSEFRSTPPSYSSESNPPPSSYPSESESTTPTFYSESKSTPPPYTSESTSTPPAYPSGPKSSSVPPIHTSKSSTAPSPTYNPYSSTFKTIPRESTSLTTITIQTSSSLSSDSTSSTPCLIVTTSSISSIYSSSSYSASSPSSSRTTYHYSEKPPPSIPSYHSSSQKTTSSYSSSPPPIPSSSTESEHYYPPKYSQHTTESVPCESDGPEGTPSGKYNTHIWEPAPPHTQAYETYKAEETPTGHENGTYGKV